MSDGDERRTTGAEGRGDHIFEVLAHNRRRYVLYAIVERAGPVSVHDLAATVAAWEIGHTIPIVETEQYDAVVLSLYHVHLPALVNAGLIEYDETREQVALTELSPQMKAGLNDILTLERTWYHDRPE